jgi:surfeit locus 1 family protein
MAESSPQRSLAIGSPFGRALLILIAAALAAALTARLGVWQLDRAAQKAAMQTEIDERARQPALVERDLAVDAASAHLQYGRTAILHGHWLADQTVYLDNRTMLDRVGFFVLTPLLLDDGTSILVQRGWVPRDAAQRTKLPVLRTPLDGVEVGGRLAAAPSQLYQLGQAETGLIRQNVELKVFAAETGLSLRPIVLLQRDMADNKDDGLLRQWTSPAIDIHKNYGYAFQWFAMSTLIVVLYVWFQLVMPRRKRTQMEHSSEQ